MSRLGLASFAAVSLLAMTAGARAADDSSQLVQSNSLPAGWYMSGSAGMTFLEDSKNRTGGGGLDLDMSADNPGFDLGGALGKSFGNGFRLEGELSYRQIGLDHATVYRGGGMGLSSGPASGDADALALMGNGYYDIKTGTPFTPYVGAGLGLARVALSDVTVNGRSFVDDNDYDFAYQAMGGVSYQLNDKGSVFLGYRYFAVDDPSLTDAAGSDMRSQLATHNVEVGYRVMF